MIKNPKKLKTITTSNSQITDIGFMGKLMYTSHEDGNLSITPLQKKSPKSKKIPAHKSKITSLKISPYNQFLSTTSIDNTLKLWNINEPMKPKQFTFKSFNGCLRNSDFSQDSKLLITAGDDKTIKLFQVYSFRFLTSLKAHKNSVKTCEFQKNSNEKIISGGFDKKVFLWDLNKKKDFFSYKAKGVVNVAKFFSEDNCKFIRFCCWGFFW